MLAVSFKLTDNIELAPPVLQFITENFSQQQAEEVKQSITDVDALRKRIQVALVKNDTDYSGNIKLLSTYYSHITQLSSRFPFGKPTPQGWIAKKRAEAVALPFTWTDSFIRKRKDTDYSIQFEQQSLLFNLGWQPLFYVSHPPFHCYFLCPILMFSIDFTRYV